MKRRTDEQVMAELGSQSPLDRARAVFSAYAARLEQEAMQRRPIGPIEARRIEFEAVEAIVAAYSRPG